LIAFHTHSRSETQALGRRLAEAVRPGLVIALRGDLGAGKTTLVQGLAAGMGIIDRVTSPTFTLVNEYRSPRGARLIHIDTYRLGDADATREAATFGLEEILEASDAVIAIEWAERVTALLPADYLLVDLVHEADEADGTGERTIRLSAQGPASASILAQLETNLF
jgi:tRNA threonylcarbamoyladenosine biosynthesis protein TsaE